MTSFLQRMTAKLLTACSANGEVSVELRDADREEAVARVADAVRSKNPLHCTVEGNKIKFRGRAWLVGLHLNLMDALSQGEIEFLPAKDRLTTMVTTLHLPARRLRLSLP